MEPALVALWLFDLKRVRRLCSRMKPICATLPKKRARHRKAPTIPKKQKSSIQLELF